MTCEISRRFADSWPARAWQDVTVMLAVSRGARQRRVGPIGVSAAADGAGPVYRRPLQPRLAR